MEHIEQHAALLARELSLAPQHVKNVIALIDEGNTIPFIARYRKEQTGTMDDQVLRVLADRLSYLRGLDARRAEITAAIDGQGKLTEELTAALENAATLAELEDLYRPYKQKRRTRAIIARERGLAPLAELLLRQDVRQGDVRTFAQPYVDGEKGVPDEDAALAGACDILAEDISDDADIRKGLRALALRLGTLTSKAIKDEDSVYRLYYDFSEPVKSVASHRVLAINRGEKEEFLRASVELPDIEALAVIRRPVVRPGSITTPLVIAAAEDAWQRLIKPSVEREIRAHLTEQASEQAIRMFGLNLEPLLMQPPVKNKVTMGFDPAYRTGCKIAVVDGTGRVLETTVVYPTPPSNKKAEAAAVLRRLIQKHGVAAIAIGNGTASKESEIFIAELLREVPGVAYMMVNEAGASVYSASKLGAEEFPDFDVSLRSAVSIARRLQDPLAELVKIDPQSIGVGQYQHDMPQARLSETLTGVVENCVGRVGVDLNTASPSLLARVSGLTAAVAKNIVAYREENGVFTDRKQLKKVPKLGPKSFVQCAGFLRVPESRNILDNTAVHPESYDAAKKLLALCGYTESDVRARALGELRERAEALGLSVVAAECAVGEPTVRDMIAELQKPGRDPRDELPPAMLRADVLDMKDLKPGMVLRGTVRNVVDFGVFVDVGVHQDGLVHVSQCSDRFIRHPSEVLRVGDVVDVAVLECDVAKKRISLSIKEAKKK